MLNLKLSSSSWNQASLPVSSGGLGIRAVLDVSLPAFLASVHASSHLINSIIHPSLFEFECEYMKEAKELWLSKFPNPQEPTAQGLQKNWDSIAVKDKFALLLNSLDNTERAILLSVSNKESGSWLEALPSSQLGTLLDNQSLQIAVALRIRCINCHPHTCVCGSSVDSFGHHGLSCVRSAGRISRHRSLNDILKRAFQSAEIPCLLEPPGLFREDGKRPDGITLLPWKMGQ